MHLDAKRFRQPAGERHVTPIQVCGPQDTFETGIQEGGGGHPHAQELCRVEPRGPGDVFDEGRDPFDDAVDIRRIGAQMASLLEDLAREVGQDADEGGVTEIDAEAKGGPGLNSKIARGRSGADRAVSVQ
jgi:hypothetical protein